MRWWKRARWHSKYFWFLGKLLFSVGAPWDSGCPAWWRRFQRWDDAADPSAPPALSDLSPLTSEVESSGRPPACDGSTSVNEHYWLFFLLLNKWFFLFLQHYTECSRLWWVIIYNLCKLCPTRRRCLLYDLIKISIWNKAQGVSRQQTECASSLLTVWERKPPLPVVL